MRRERFDEDVEPLVKRVEALVELTAPFARRTCAFFIDLAPFLILPRLFEMGGPGIEVAGALGLYTLYHWLLVGATGRTLGKVLLGIHVEFLDGYPARWLYALLRPTTGYVISCVSVIGLVQFALHKRHSTFHDLIFSTWVLRTKRAAGWGWLQSLDEFSQAVDAAFQRALGKLGPLGRLVSYLVAAHFGIGWIVHGVRTAIAKVQRTSGKLESSRQAGASGGQSAAGQAIGSSAPASVMSTAAAPVLTSLMVAGGVLATYEAVVPRPLSIVSWMRTLNVLDLSGRWEFTNVQINNDGFYQPLDLRGSTIVFEPVDAGFVVADGPDFLRGAVLRPRLTDADATLASDSSRWRADCVDMRDGTVVAENVYENLTTWTFEKVEISVDEGSLPENRPERIRFRYLSEGVKDSNSPVAASCRDSTSLEVLAEARRIEHE